MWILNLYFAPPPLSPPFGLCNFFLFKTKPYAWCLAQVSWMKSPKYLYSEKKTITKGDGGVGYAQVYVLMAGFRQLFSIFKV